MRTRAKGFTLLELILALSIMSLLSLALYGVVSIGASAAGAGERKMEQTRRLRVAASIIGRQLRSAAPLYVAYDEEEEQAKPYFLGYEDGLEFVTASPQGPSAAGRAIVHYWVEDGKLMMSETPYFLAYDEKAFERDADALRLEAVLLYDVDDASFSYERSNYDSDQWETSWDASEEDVLPAAVRIEITPAVPGVPALLYEVPVVVGVMNEITGEEDFRGQRRSGPSLRSRREAKNEEKRQAQDDAADEDHADFDEDDDFDEDF